MIEIRTQTNRTIHFLTVIILQFISVAASELGTLSSRAAGGANSHSLKIPK